MGTGNLESKVIKLIRLGSNAVSVLRLSETDFRVEVCKYFLGLKFLCKKHSFKSQEEAIDFYYDVKNDLMLKHRTFS